jgi:hypothetical protein
MAAESACPLRRAVPKSLTEMGFRAVPIISLNFGLSGLRKIGCKDIKKP